MLQRDPLYLDEIVEAAGHIRAFITGQDLAAFLASELVKSAVLQKLSLIGEAANRLSPERRNQYPQIPWRSLIGLRNAAVHAYFAIKWEVIWETATTDVPALAEQIDAIRRELE